MGFIWLDVFFNDGDMVVSVWAGMFMLEVYYVV